MTDERFGLIETCEQPDGVEALGYVSSRRARGPSGFKQNEVAKTLKASKAAGVPVRIETPGGLVITSNDQPNGVTNPWDEVLDGKPTLEIRSRLS